MADKPWRGRSIPYDAAKQRLESLGFTELGPARNDHVRWRTQTDFYFYIPRDMDNDTLEGIVETVREEMNKRSQ